MTWQWRIHRWTTSLLRAWVWTVAAALGMYAVVWTCDKVLMLVVWVIS